MAYEIIFAQQLSELTGNPYVWEGLAIAFYIAGMGAGSYKYSQVDTLHPIRNFYRLELALGIFAAFCPIIVDALQIVYRIYSFNSGGLLPSNQFLSPVSLFGLSCCPIIFCIGYLTGVEFSIILEKSKNTLVVLSVYNFGLFAAAITFANLGHLIAPYKTFPIVASLNIALALFVLNKAKSLVSRTLSATFIIGVLLVTTTIGTYIEELQLKNFYLNSDEFLAPSHGKLQTKETRSIFKWINESSSYTPVDRIRSPYQIIDIVENEEPQMFINGRFQVSRDTAASYHQPFSQVPQKIFSQNNLASILVLGGGDGILVKELLRSSKASITVIELDERVVNLANTSPWLTSLNSHSLQSPRVNLKYADAFAELRSSGQLYDAIYIDITYPFDFDSARFYSYEFLRLVSKNLTKEGFFTVGLPLDPKPHDMFAKTVYSTLYKAGFRSMFSFKGDIDSFLTASTSKVKFDEKRIFLEGMKIDISKMHGTFEQKFVHSLFRPKFYGTGDPFY